MPSRVTANAEVWKVEGTQRVGNYSFRAVRLHKPIQTLYLIWYSSFVLFLNKAPLPTQPPNCVNSGPTKSGFAL